MSLNALISASQSLLASRRNQKEFYNECIRVNSSMKSTKELQQDFQTPWSHESEEDSVEENEPRSSRITPVLKERERLLREMNGDKISTSTPIEGVSNFLAVSRQSCSKRKLQRKLSLEMK